MARVKRLIIEGYRSIDSEIEIEFPEKVPLVLIGENNAGKSNIVRALDLLLGEQWPGSYEPEDHDFFDRVRDQRSIKITAELESATIAGRSGPRTIERIWWQYKPREGASLKMEFKDDREPVNANNAARGQCVCIYVGADRRLSYHLSFASRYTFLSKLTKRFHNSLTSDEHQQMALQQALDSVKTQFEAFPDYKKFANILKEQIEEFSGNLEYQLSIDFATYDPSNYFRSLRVQPAEAGQTRNFDELGTGQEQILAICFARAYAETFHEDSGLLIVIEEPEAHLHPLAQRWVAQKLRELAKAGVQVVITTHSPAFLDVMGLEGWVRVYKCARATKVVQLTAEKLAEYCRATGAKKASAENILSYYAAGATESILAGMFARKVFLVEGPTEALALPVYLSKVGLNATQAGIAITPVGGKGSLARWWRLFTAFDIPCYISFDNDRKDDPDYMKRADALVAVGFQGDSSHLMQSEEMEVEHLFTVFGNEFETCMKRLFDNDYTMLEDEARTIHGLTSRDAKPLLARYVAERLNIDKYPDGCRKFRDLAERVQALALSTASMVANRNLSLSAHEQSPVDDFYAEQDEEFDDIPF